MSYLSEKLEIRFNFTYFTANKSQPNYILCLLIQFKQRKRERERETDRQTERDRERQKDRK